ncbi:hypothetical protein Tcan_09459 [Toxocara canis]|uniref:Uncharacterized protein n=1 Tax=Toxocara canis TaxID=6265 RepID=A0A0B2VD24_TOXCA|nr:hypothetical protein Tcan_09459 [Toxocara canis]
MDSDSDSRPLLSGAKAVVYTQNEGPGVHYALVRRSGIPLSVPDAVTSSLCSEKLNSTATMSVDSAIGSPLWPIGVNTSMLLDGGEICAASCDSSERLTTTQRLLAVEDSQLALSSSTANEEQLRLNSEKGDSDDETFADGRFQPHYVNLPPDEDGPHRGQSSLARFISVLYWLRRRACSAHF